MLDAHWVDDGWRDAVQKLKNGGEGLQNIYEDFPGDSVTKIPSAGRPGLIPGQGARSHMLQPGAAK